MPVGLADALTSLARPRHKRMLGQVYRAVLVLLGAFIGLVAAFVFDIGAGPCQDYSVVTAACALPQPSRWGVAVSVAVGVALPLAAFRFDDRRSRG